MTTRDPSQMSEDERMSEIALLLALGFLRDRQIQLDASASLKPLCAPKG